MTPALLYGLVILSAIAHAIWNALVKSAGDRGLTMVAIRAAAQALSNYRLPGSTLYVTLEPCSMCAGLIVHSRIARVVYGALEPKAGIVQSQGQFFTQGFLNHRVLFEGGVLAEECGTVLSEFFKARRAKPAD